MTETKVTYELFTDRARKVMQLANEEARRFDHDHIGTEHVLLGLVKVGVGVAANVLKNLDVDLRKIRLEVERIVQSGPDMVTMGRLPQTPRAKKVIEYSMDESRNLNHNYVGTEHILLGLLREQEGVAAQVLMNLGLKLEDVRTATLEILTQHTGRTRLTYCVDCKWHEAVTLYGLPAHFCRALPREVTKDPVTGKSLYVSGSTGGRSRNKYPECQTINTNCNCTLYQEKENGTAAN